LLFCQLTRSAVSTERNECDGQSTGVATSELRYPIRQVASSLSVAGRDATRHQAHKFILVLVDIAVPPPSLTINVRVEKVLLNVL